MSESREPRELRRSDATMLVLYAAMIAAGVGLFLLVWLAGRGLVAPGAPPLAPSVAAPRQVDLLGVLVALLTIIVVARALGGLFKLVHQPPVIGEILAGILLGPSLLGRVAPTISDFVLPISVMPDLQVLSLVGVILFMFLVGVELDTRLLRNKPHVTIAISHASITVPFVLGAVLALGLYPLSSSGVPFSAFALFIGVSMSVTAFPVLARILIDRGIEKTPIGVLALSCAAVDDVTAWCLLALVVSVVDPQTSSAATTFVLTATFIAAMFLVVQPAVARWVRRQEATEQPLTDRSTAFVLVGLIVAAATTEAIGIHAVFGAFMLGAVIPCDSLLARSLSTKLKDLVIVLLLPAFFAYTGMRTQIGLLSSVDDWLIAGAIVLVACLGKFGGTTVAARLVGLSWRDASCLGILMNTRGLMGLVVLNVGLDLGVISPTLFTMMVMMTLITTFATTPILQLLTTESDVSRA